MPQVTHRGWAELELNSRQTRSRVGLEPPHHALTEISPQQGGQLALTGAKNLRDYSKFVILQKTTVHGQIYSVCGVRISWESYKRKRSERYLGAGGGGDDETLLYTELPLPGVTSHLEAQRIK